MGFQKAYNFLFREKFTEAEKEAFKKEAMEKRGGVLGVKIVKRM